VADRPPAQRTLYLEYRFDRLLAQKLVQAYELLIPDKRWPAGGEPASRQEVVNEETCRPLRARFV
jgi:hypothetical protein